MSGGARRLLPWETRVSRLAGLPTKRAEWLRIVLPVLTKEPSYPRATAALAALGYDLPRWTVAGWATKLAEEHAAGRLREARKGLPERKPSGRAWRAAQGLPVEVNGIEPPKPRRATGDTPALDAAGFSRIAALVESAGVSAVAASAGLSPSTLRRALAGGATTDATNHALAVLADLADQTAN